MKDNQFYKINIKDHHFVIRLCGYGENGKMIKGAIARFEMYRISRMNKTQLRDFLQFQFRTLELSYNKIGEGAFYGSRTYN